MTPDLLSQSVYYIPLNRIYYNQFRKDYVFLESCLLGDKTYTIVKVITPVVKLRVLYKPVETNNLKKIHFVLDGETL